MKQLAIFTRLLIFICPLLPFSSILAKDMSNFWQDKDGILMAQTELAFDLVNNIIANDPPSVGVPSDARRAALYLLDQIFHDTRLDNSPLISSFLDARMILVCDELSRPLEKGLKVFKLYNDGWIVQTPEITIGWDIYRGRKVKDSNRRLMSDSIAEALAEACDILFLTHNHGDHVDPFVIDCFKSLGKPVIAPNEVLPGDSSITHTRKETMWEQTFITASGKSINATILPGHQDHLQNNIYIVTTPDGYTVSSTGDQWLKEDLDMLLNLEGIIPEVDIFMPICWAACLEEMCKSFGAKIVLTGHENELGDHTIDHREPYWLSLNKLENFSIPNSVMTWGEYFYYDPMP